MSAGKLQVTQLREKCELYGTQIMFEARASADCRMAAHTVDSALSRIALAAADNTAVDFDGWSSPGCSGRSYATDSLIFKKYYASLSPT